MDDVNFQVKNFSAPFLHALPFHSEKRFRISQTIGKARHFIDAQARLP